MLHLGHALSARGHSVRFATQPEEGAAFAVAVNDARLLPGGGALPILWLHNEVTWWREMRRGRLAALWRHRPVAVFCGTRQAGAASRLLPFRRRLVVPHGLPAAILQEDPAEAPPGPEVVFISQAYRGLADTVAMWRDLVAPRHPAARLRAFIAVRDVARYTALAAGVPAIDILPRVPNAEMPRLLRGARVLAAPGHRAETFCLAAAEAQAMGVPVVTLGHGALAERVDHGRTGFICRDRAEMAERILALLGDDAVWRAMHAACLATRANAGWDHVAQLWEDRFRGGGRNGRVETLSTQFW